MCRALFSRAKLAEELCLPHLVCLHCTAPRSIAPVLFAGCPESQQCCPSTSFDAFVLHFRHSCESRSALSNRPQNDGGCMSRRVRNESAANTCVRFKARHTKAVLTSAAAVDEVICSYFHRPRGPMPTFQRTWHRSKLIRAAGSCMMRQLYA